MKIHWFAVLVTIGILSGATAYFYGARPSLAALGLLLLAWWIAYTYSGSPMDRAYNEYLHFDEEMKKEFMDQASPEMRSEIEKRLREESEPIQSATDQRP